jgi:GTP-binding protein EngB required for normal cell division
MSNIEIKRFQELETEEEFNTFMQMQHQDDANLKKRFEEYTHRQFQYCLINMGIMLDIVRGYFYFERQKLNETIVKLDKDKVKKRRVNKMLKELNQKINLRYDFDDDVEIIPSLAIYQEEGYLMIDKSLFADLLMEKADVPL